MEIQCLATLLHDDICSSVEFCSEIYLTEATCRGTSSYSCLRPLCNHETIQVTVTEERHEAVDIGPLPLSDWPKDATDATESFDGPKDSGSV